MAMACNSIQSSSVTWKHDVFVSFRGDTRNNFTDHLFGAFDRKGIDAFRDDTKLKRGEPISSELMQAIEGSCVLIVVFSKNYASSTWCLRELAKIADCVNVSGQHVRPIFYDVDPSEVRKQSGNYEKAFAEHEERFKGDSEMMVQVQRWRAALTQVASLSGWDVRDKPHYAEIEKIVEEIRSIFGHKFSSIPNDLVGWQCPVKELEKLLLLGSGDDVRVVGICGMGGIGKTTLATVLYDRISPQFDACCFIDDVSKIFRDCGPIGVPKQLLCQTLNAEHLQICNLSKAANLIQSRLCHLRTLIVLDNVDKVEQLDKLAMNREWLGTGSRIIIISRDEHILREYEVDDVYKVQLLNDANALRLFCRKAFKCGDIMEDYRQLTDNLLKYATGLPLAIKVLGSFLYGRDVFEWRSALARLREYPKTDIMDVLRISFDGLEDMEKEIFLDIACFFDRQDESYVKKFLDFRGFHPDIGIRVLIDKSLITREWRMIVMHPLLKELGRNIVREKSPREPRKWSRLWEYKDLLDVMSDNMAAENLEAIVLKRYPVKVQETTMKADALSKMRHLKLLILWNVKFAGCLTCLSNDLVYLSWDEYPFTCLPLSFQPDKLVELILPNSSIEQLWEGTKHLHNLRRMDLSNSKNLVKLPDFREVPNLEWLCLEGCIKLVRIDPSIGILRKLGWLILKNCKNLVSIPDSIFGLSSLGCLNLSGCSKLLNNQLLEKPRYAEFLEKLDTNESTSTIQCQSTSSIFKILMLPFHFFYSRRHEDSIGLLWPSLPRFPCLRCLDLSFCNLLEVPDAIGKLHCLRSLNLGGNNFIMLPCSIKHLSKLRSLNLEHCKKLKYLPELPEITAATVVKGCGGGLYIFDCPNLSELEHCYNTAFSWMIQIIKVGVQSSLAFGQFDLIISGTQIPTWFKKQNVGSSISLDPSPIMRDNNWIGIACCAIFVARDDPTQLGNEWKEHIECGFEIIKHNRGAGGIFTISPIHLEKDLVTVGSNHLLLVFFTREGFIRWVSEFGKGMHDLDGIKMSTHINQPPGLHLEVKNCGYRWVFKKDLEQLNLSMRHSGYPSVRKRKFLAINDQSQP